MELLTVVIFVVLTYGGVTSNSIQAEGQLSTDMAGQGISFYLMGEVFRLKGVVEEIKTTQLKRIEEDIEDLQEGAVQPEQNNKDDLEEVRKENDALEKNNERISRKIETLTEGNEELRKENEAIRVENKEMKAEIDHLSQEFERMKSLRLDAAISKLQEHDLGIETVLATLQSFKNGVTYVRWGRSVCPADSEKVYTGYAGGGHSAHSGSGANWLCLTDEPQYGYHEDNTDAGALVYGGEYEFGDIQRNGGRGFFGKDLNDLDAICVVCRPPRTSVLMIPGRNTCYSGWKLEYRRSKACNSTIRNRIWPNLERFRDFIVVLVIYKYEENPAKREGVRVATISYVDISEAQGQIIPNGYLVASYISHSASNFICLDSRPEPRKGSQANRDGKDFYLATGICGSLPCPPYVNGRQLTCVVCSK